MIHTVYNEYRTNSVRSAAAIMHLLSICWSSLPSHDIFPLLFNALIVNGIITSISLILQLLLHAALVSTFVNNTIYKV